MAITDINLSGKVRNDAGAGVEGITVYLLHTASDLAGTQEDTTTTNDAGTWSFTETSLDVNYDIKIESSSGSQLRYIPWSDEITLKTVDTSVMKVRGASNAAAAPIYLFADLATDAGDAWRIQATDSDTLAIGSDKASAGTIIDYITVTNGANAAASNTTILGQLTIGVDDTGADVKFFGATSGKYWLWDESADGVVQIGTLTIGVDGTGHDVKFFGATSGAYMLWDESADDLVLAGAAGIDLAGDIDVDGTANLDAVDIDGAVQIDGTVTVGVDDTGQDVKFFGATAGSFLLWDESDDALELTDSSPIKIGDGGDMTIYHDGSHSYITNATGALKLATETSGIAVTIGHSTSEVTVADNLTVTGNLTVSGTQTVVDTVTMNAANALVFEGATADGNETTLTIIDPTADRTVYVPNQTGYLPVLAAASTTQISATPEELNVLDAVTAGTVSASLGVVVDSNKDIGTFRNVTLSGELDAATLDISGNADIDGTTNLDAVDIDGAVQIDGTVTVGVDDTGYDVKFFGATASQYLLWDESSDELVLAGDTKLSFHDAAGGENIIASANGHLEVNSGTTLDITAPTVDLNSSTEFNIDTAIYDLNASGAVTIDAAGLTTITGTNDAVGAIYLRENAGTSGTVKIHADQGTSVTEGAESVTILSDAGGVGIRSTANLANAVNITVDGGTTSSMTLFNDQGTGATEGSASIQLLSDVGGINIKSGLDGANAILLTADGGTSETIVIHADQGTGTGSIELLSDAGGIELDAGTDIILDAGGADIFLKDDGTLFGTLTNSGGELVIKSSSSGTTAATFSGANVTLAGTVGSGAITSTGIIKTDDTTNATSTTDGSLQTDGGLSVVLDAIFGDDVTLITDSAVLNLGVGSDVSITHDGTTGGTISGTPMVYESLGASSLANDKHTGLVLEFLAGESIAVGQLVYMSTVDGRVSLADANDTGDSGHYPAIGVAVSAQGSAGSAVKILTHGTFNDSDGFGGDLTEGNVLYLSETAGAFTATAPSDDGDRVQVVGIAIGPRDVFINPSLDVIEHD